MKDFDRVGAEYFFPRWTHATDAERADPSRWAVFQKNPFLEPRAVACTTEDVCTDCGRCACQGCDCECD